MIIQISPVIGRLEVALPQNATCPQLITSRRESFRSGRLSIRYSCSRRGFSLHFMDWVVVMHPTSLILVLVPDQTVELCYFQLTGNGWLTTTMDGQKYILLGTTRRLEPQMMHTNHASWLCSERACADIMNGSSSSVVMHADRGVVTKKVTYSEFVNMQMLNVPGISVESIPSNSVYFMLTMPALPGVHVYYFLQTEVFPRTHSQLVLEVYTESLLEIHAIPQPILWQLCRAFLDLFDRVHRMNTVDGIFHNDLHMGNCIYDKTTNRLEMIDYEFVTFDHNPCSAFFSATKVNLLDTDLIRCNIQYLLLCGCVGDDSVYRQLNEHGLFFTEDVHLLEQTAFGLDLFTQLEFVDKCKAMMSAMSVWMDCESESDECEMV